MPEQRSSHGAPFARGNTSDLWDWSDQSVIKVLRPEIPTHWAAIEADILSRVHAAGLPVPEVEGVIDFDGRPGVVMERVDGVAMWERMKTDPTTVPGLVGRLIDLQAEVQSTSTPGIVSMTDRLQTKIGPASSTRSRPPCCGCCPTSPPTSADTTSS